MNAGRSEDDRLVRYLLGEALPEDEQSALEERYFTDDLYFDRLLAVEDDLIDSHIRGTLPESDRTKFETSFLASNRRREKWEAQRAIASFFRDRVRPRNFLHAGGQFLRSLTPGTRLLLVASGLVLLAGIGVLTRGYVILRRETFTLQSRMVALGATAPRLSNVATFLLRAERLKSGTGDALQIPSDARWIVLRCALPAAASRYLSFSAELSTADGEEIWRQNRLTANESVVEMSFPTAALKHDDYILSLTAAEGTRPVKLPSYQFRVDR